MACISRSFRVLIALVLALFIFPSLQRASVVQTPQPVISTPAEVKAEFESVPCKSNEERLAAAKALFEKMGASAADISIEKYKKIENLVVRKSGASPETIVIGAHYDKVAEGCGAVDNWTGIVVLVHLYRSLRDVPTTKTILFVAFGNEEKGLEGSHAMVNKIDKAQLVQYCEMINMDSFGLSAPQVADNMSSPKLAKFIASLAKEMAIPFNHAAIKNADGDSSAFIARKIPAVTIHGLSNEWPNILHSRADKVSKVNFDKVYLGYRLTIAAIVRLDSANCSEYR